MERLTARPSRTAAPARRAVGRRRPPGLIAVILVLVGVLVMLYPVGATVYNNAKQREFASLYNNEVQTVPDTTRIAALAAARDYNTSFAAVPILDPWLSKAKQHPDTSDYGRYAGQLNATDAMARLRVPKARIDLPVFHDTTEAVLAKGVGHLYGTSLPVGGTGTHAVLTSHTGLANATLFDHLNTLVEGDLIYVDVYGETLAYQVDQIKIVLPDQVGDLTAVPGQDLLTLFTCTPYAVNTHRLLVRAHRVPFEKEVAAHAQQQQSTFVIEPWMWWMIGGAAASMALLTVVLVASRARPPRPRYALS